MIGLSLQQKIKEYFLYLLLHLTVYMGVFLNKYICNFVIFKDDGKINIEYDDTPDSEKMKGADSQ